ncbi:MAG: radical SAM/Cys-rich domain protein [Planctomycetota bacterium]|nr:MAG: radical SAM/Cys-rich domain protein [Planctomycetota bacterium]
MLLGRALNHFDEQLAAHALPALRRTRLRTLQVNLGKLCNQACRHCHVDAGPTRTEMMSGDTVDALLALLARNPSVERVDITGGAPELNPHFRRLVRGVVQAGREVMVRCNLTVLQQAEQRDTAAFYAAQGVHVIASLPCYTAENVDRQRGGGVFADSIKSLQELNALGYGAAEGAPDEAVRGVARTAAVDMEAGALRERALRLDLVFNPLGPSLPPAQAALESDYRARLAADFGLRFDQLYVLANMPIHRFADDLERSGKLHDYELLLRNAFNPASVNGLMCRELLSIDWDGSLADCDFHQMLGLPLGAGLSALAELTELENLGALDGAAITTADHCLGCTAGQGSSCGGALTGEPAAAT